MPFKLWIESHLFYQSKEDKYLFQLKNEKKKATNKQTPNQLLTILSTFHSLAHSPVSYISCVQD